MTLTFSELSLRPELQEAVAAEGYTTPTPIQVKAIPDALNGTDILGIAQTGTGKTAAFVLPILQRLAEVPSRTNRERPMLPRSLILTPTRELAAQIGASIAAYGAKLDLRHTVIFGGVGQNPQVEALRRGVHILVATPGRLLDLMNQGHVRLGGLEIFVLDEADRMLDMGFIHDVRKVVAKLPAERQTMFFSATMPGEIQGLADKLLKNPVRVEVSPVAKTADRIDQHVIRTTGHDKRQVLCDLLLGNSDMSRVIVFTRTKHGANKVAQVLGKSGVVADAIHGNKSQNARIAALEGFRAGKVRVLVATDLAARGIDVDIEQLIRLQLTPMALPARQAPLPPVSPRGPEAAQAQQQQASRQRDGGGRQGEHRQGEPRRSNRRRGGGKGGQPGGKPQAASAERQERAPQRSAQQRESLHRDAQQRDQQHRDAQHRTGNNPPQRDGRSRRVGHTGPNTSFGSMVAALGSRDD
jgi:superfamily II DNA/RNA helicase